MKTIKNFTRCDDFFNKLVRELDKKYYPHVAYYRDNENTTKIHYAVELFNNGVTSLNKLVKTLSKACADTQENVYQIVLKYLIDSRKERLMPNGIPRWIRCYDNGGAEKDGTLDRYTVVFTKKSITKNRPHAFMHLGMNAAPFHPQGIAQHGDSEGQPIDRPTYGHLGKKIRFEDLPQDCKDLVLRDYKELWNLK